MITGLAGRSVVVTGASRGIGRGIASAFVAAGAMVTIIADDPAVTRTADEIGATGKLADITDAEAVREALSGLSVIDVLVNNAGLERMTPVDGPSPETEDTFRRILDINVAGTFIVTRAALSLMTEGGRIINTASVWGRVAEPLFAAYVASKHAVIGLTKTLARELGPRGITVNAVCPGWVKTEASMRSLAMMSERSGEGTDVLLEGILGAQALPGLMEPDDVAGPYLYLASDWAKNVTGQSLGIDRGEVPW
ncbi:Diacetyl reductase [(S)-acetoin forming] [Hartmannibacter diazotrophicus]|uniref:Diacetyl reductase [(S)-acetoin forming] n=1 Tax=Hartmannibacter diazotrophicus TaxID=1482074 RepID=A0A2C9D933_9HYPH|nr:SDR family NAD(P)-dependent oxidoreductase [Hartmannibacter diazotrophicus]SON56832.1 Diacetyl reductase [(S)-acetoin forming] [Hartmannibacter diazotrophicus]